MEAVRLNPRIAGTRERQIQDAKNMQRIVEDRLTKKALTPPAYEFLELIGKGAYGRVYKRYVVLQFATGRLNSMANNSAASIAKHSRFAPLRSSKSMFRTTRQMSTPKTTQSRSSFAKRVSCSHSRTTAPRMSTQSSRRFRWTHSFGSSLSTVLAAVSPH